MDMSIGRLEDNRNTFRAVLSSMGEGLIAMDAQGIITAVNPYALEALGYDEADLLGTWFPGSIIATDRYNNPLPNTARPVVRALTSGETVSEHMYYLRRNQTAMPVYITVSPVVLDGRPQGAIELFRDITKDRQLDWAKDEFVALASHQLRTPATGVRAILSMVSDGDFGALNAKQLMYIRKAIASNDRQLQLIEDILNVAQVDAGRMKLDPEQSNLAVIVGAAIADLAQTFAARDQIVDATGLQAAAAWVDAPKIRMVFDNLLSNASKYTPVGGLITVSSRQLSHAVTVDVRDTGVGIAAEDLPKLFMKFSRIGNQLSQGVGGSGLGLYLTHHIVGLHHGELTVRSRPNYGSTFSIMLPVSGSRL